MRYAIKSTNMIFCILLVFLSGYGMAQAQNYQIVTPNPQAVSAAPGTEISFTVQYDVSDHDNTLTGLGLRIHYNSSLLEWQGFSDVLQTDKLGESTSPQDDTDNSDNDASTDKVLLVSWVDISGNWPGSALPLNLVTVNFKAKKASETLINFTADTAAGYSLKTQSVKVTSY